MDLDVLDSDNHARVERTLRALEEHGVHALFAADREAARKAVLDMIPRGAAVAHGASATLQEVGLIDSFKSVDSGYRYLNPEWQAENDAARRMRLRARLSVEADYFLGSVQAICETGQVIGVDAVGSRQAFYIFGPPHVIWVAGMNKIVPTLEDGLRRVREVALPLEDKRIRASGGPGSRIGQLVIFEAQRPGRITLVLVGEALGF